MNRFLLLEKGNVILDRTSLQGSQGQMLQRKKSNFQVVLTKRLSKVVLTKHSTVVCQLVFLKARAFILLGFFKILIQ